MQHRVVAELAIGAKPGALHSGVRLRLEQIHVVDFTTLDGPVELKQEVDRRMR